ncbi:hypothetical protein APY04_1964 [Hyphomicrobium sulfonivorans]|uniref:Uncharacterized protein n=1 Tax=Hyphomicrobium sulfonivorans TaxID=121290 RepID=A0A109BEL1_HYPSL|nr:hypothetical protein [Hyphomicrobium sulfonivorans]KWT67399.1 hypothetical protein APY04_1964 [Hyphomicrobium sulfonivorans]
MSLRTNAPWSHMREAGAGYGYGFESDSDWAEPEAKKRDWKKIVLIVGLAALSWVATYVGMLELIESNMGSLPLVHKAIIGFSVAMLMTMVVWLLDQMFSPIDWFTRLTYIFGYIFLTLISVGFGFGFYWKVLESRSEAARSAESAVGQVQSALHGATTRLEQLNSTLIQLAAVSTQKATLEREKGSTCPNSSPGDGPRRKLRDEDAQRFSFASDFVTGRVGSIKSDMALLDGDMAKIVKNDASTMDAHGTRNEFMRSLGRRLDMTVTGFNAFRTDPQLRQIRADLADRAERSSFSADNGKTFACPDAQLQASLRGVVRAIDQLPTLEKPQIAAVEGSEATIEAFRRLTATFVGLLSFELPPSADELRTLQQRAVQSIDNPTALAALNNETVGLSQRDYIPLGVALFVDLCLLLVSIGRPMNRFVATRQSMIDAERGPVFPILSRFSQIHNHDEMRGTFDVFREVIFESGGTYYVAVPLNAPREHPQRDELLREAQMLANLCYALEGQGILARPWKIAPGLVAARKLRRQGSKFIECYRDAQVAPVPRAMRALGGMFIADNAGEDRPAFRIYAFKRGAWPEMILGAVMGAARRMETELQRQRVLSLSVVEDAHVRAEFERSILEDRAPESGCGHVGRTVDSDALDVGDHDADERDVDLAPRRHRSEPRSYRPFRHRPGMAEKMAEPILDVVGRPIDDDDGFAFDPEWDAAADEEPEEREQSEQPSADELQAEAANEIREPVAAPVIAAPMKATPASTPPAAPVSPAPATPPMRAGKEPDAALRQRFGSYAGLAEAELASYQDIEDDADEAEDAIHADAETAGADQRPADADAFGREEIADEPEQPGNATAVVVPFPHQVATTPVGAEKYSNGAAASSEAATGSDLAARLAAALADSDGSEEPGGWQSIDLELKRETATLRVPVSHAALPAELLRLARSTPGATLQTSEITADEPQLELALETTRPTESALTRPETVARIAQLPSDQPLSDAEEAMGAQWVAPLDADGDACDFDQPALKRPRVLRNMAE